MTAKEYLSRYSAIKMEVKRLNDLIDELQALSEYVSPSFDAGSGGYVSDKVGNNAAKIADMKKKLERQIGEMLKEMGEIQASIDRVEDPKLRYILSERYINGRLWEDIAGEFNYSVRQIHRLHGRALQKVVIECHY